MMTGEDGCRQVSNIKHTIAGRRWVVDGILLFTRAIFALEQQLWSWISVHKCHKRIWKRAPQLWTLR